MNLQRQLGWKEATSLGIGAMVGAGIFVLSGVAVGKAGPAVMVSFIIAAVLEILVGLCYAELATRYPKAGGAYVYVSKTMGAFCGALVGWSYWGAWLAASSFISQGFGKYLYALTGAPPLLSGIALLIVLGVLNILGIKLSGTIQIGIVVIEIVVLIGYFMLGVPHVNFELYIPFAPNGLAGTLEAALVGFLSMVGWDAIVDAGEEIKNPRQNIPKSIFLSIFTVLCLYFGLLFVLTGVVSWNELGISEAPVALASKQFLGNFGPVFVNLIIIIALPATANAVIISTSRTALAMGRNNLLPKNIAVIHPRFQTPIWAIVLSVSVQVLFTLASSVNIAVTATGFLYLLTFIFTMIAFFISRRQVTEAEKSRQFMVPFYPAIPLAALAICISLLIPVGGKGFIAGLVWLLLGTALYVFRNKLLNKAIQLPVKGDKVEVLTTNPE